MRPLSSEAKSGHQPPGQRTCMIVLKRGSWVHSTALISMGYHGCAEAGAGSRHARRDRVTRDPDKGFNSPPLPEQISRYIQHPRLNFSRNLLTCFPGPYLLPTRENFPLVRYVRKIQPTCVRDLV